MGGGVAGIRHRPGGGAWLGVAGHRHRPLSVPLVGQPYRADTKRSEAERYVREALLVSPYIREVQVTDTTFEGSTIHIAVDLTTVYGRASVYV